MAEVNKKFDRSFSINVEEMYLSDYIRKQDGE
jgi:hypothetical protein